MSCSSLVTALALVSLLAGCGGSTSSEVQPAGDAGDASLGDGSTSLPDGGTTQDGASGVDTTCSGPGTCELGEPGCCGVGCGAPTVGSYVGIRRGQQDALFRATSPSPTT